MEDLGLSTPQDFFDEVDREFGFVFDAAALPDNAKCPFYCTPEEDGLSQPWADPTWCNPPWVEADQWVKKAVGEADRGVTSVLLLPVWEGMHWYRLCELYGEVRRVGRLSFDGVESPWDCVLVVFRGKKNSQ